MSPNLRESAAEEKAVQHQQNNNNSNQQGGSGEGLQRINSAMNLSMMDYMKRYICFRNLLDCSCVLCFLSFVCELDECYLVQTMLMDCQNTLESFLISLCFCMLQFE